MVKPRTIQNKVTGKFEGSIGVGKTAVPTVAKVKVRTPRENDYITLFKADFPLATKDVRKALTGMNILVGRETKPGVQKRFALKGLETVNKRWFEGLHVTFGYGLTEREKGKVLEVALDEPTVPTESGIPIFGLPKDSVTLDFSAIDSRYQQLADFVRELKKGEN